MNKEVTESIVRVIAYLDGQQLYLTPDQLRFIKREMEIMYRTGYVKALEESCKK